MIEKVSTLILLTVLPVVLDVAAGPWPARVEARQGRAATAVSADYLSPQPSLETLTRFSEEEVPVAVTIPFETEYVDDPESEIGTEKILQEGVAGVRRETFLVQYWRGEEIGRELLNVELTPPQNQVAARGTKIIWWELETKDAGGLRYWRKLRVWATSYDGNCLGCRGLTYSGTPVTYGTLAVDPAVIPLGTSAYIPGYGVGRAEDIGGSIKGDKIDLGFDEVSKGWWQAQWTDVYLLD